MLTCYRLTVYVLSEDRNFNEYEILAPFNMTLRDLGAFLAYPPWYYSSLPPHFSGYHLPGPLLSTSEGETVPCPQIPIQDSFFATFYDASIVPQYQCVHMNANVLTRAMLYSPCLVICF